MKDKQDKQKQLSPAEFIKYAAENHIKFTLPENNRKYPMQHCQDDLVNQKFRVLHKQIVNAIIQFCKENNIMIDEFNLYADGLEDSIKHGQWCPSTDSCFRMDETLERENGKSVWEMNNEEYKLAKIKHEPILISM